MRSCSSPFFAFRLLPEGDLDYTFINDIARKIAGKDYNPQNGLSVEQMQNVLNALKIPYSDLDYAEVSKIDSSIRENIPYQKYLYAGIESGCGGLLGFKMADPNEPSRHIIPFYGHTFNKDTWTPDAEAHYFNIGLNWLICCKSNSALLWPLSSSTEKRSGDTLITCSACVPIEPVDPSIARFFFNCFFAKIMIYMEVYIYFWLYI